MNKTKIEYLDFTWNPVTGCAPVSAGCEHCWARRMHERGLWGKRPFSEVTMHPEWLDEPMRCKKPARIGVCFSGDLFHEKVPSDFIWRIFANFQYAKQHTYLVLTKRPQRMFEAVTAYIAEGQVFDHPTPYLPFPNVWLGVSVEDQKTADERIPLLFQTPAALRYVSYMPALGPVDLTCINEIYSTGDPEHPLILINNVKKIDWIIMGGESGPGARPMHPEWARSARDQCQAAGVPFYFKQWGEWVGATGLPHKYPATERWVPVSSDPGLKDGLFMRRVGKKAAGHILDGREWLEIPKGK